MKTGMSSDGILRSDTGQHRHQDVIAGPEKALVFVLLCNAPFGCHAFKVFFFMDEFHFEQKTS